PVFEALQRRQGRGFSSFASRENLGPVKRNGCCALVVFLKAGPGNPRFDAAVFPAVAGGPGKFLRAHPRESVVPPFAGNAIRTAVDAAIHGDSAAAARAKNHPQDDMFAGSRSVCGFGNREAIRIVRATNFTAEGPA